jgi:hypothetical protein
VQPSTEHARLWGCARHGGSAHPRRRAREEDEGAADEEQPSAERAGHEGRGGARPKRASVLAARPRLRARRTRAQLTDRSHLRSVLTRSAFIAALASLVSPGRSWPGLLSSQILRRIRSHQHWQTFSRPRVWRK